MITETGRGLHVLIVSEPSQNWQTFATWYSFYKNVPEAKVCVSCWRTGDTPFAYYQWAKRLKVPVSSNRCLVYPEKEPDDRSLNVLQSVRQYRQNLPPSDWVLAVRPSVLAADVLDHKTLSLLNQKEAIFDRETWFVSAERAATFIDAYYLEGSFPTLRRESLCVEAKDCEEPSCLISHVKGCGKWINTAKGCPFSNAAGFVTAEMTANEHRIIEMWKKMVTLYNAVI